MEQRVRARLLNAAAWRRRSLRAYIVGLKGPQRRIDLINSQGKKPTAEEHQSPNTDSSQPQYSSEEE